MSARSKYSLLALLLALGLLYRLFAAYPMELGRFAPASSALQAMHILEGARPIFYSGQSWMGPAGAYLIALMFKLLGPTSWTLAIFSLLMSALFLGLTVRLALRLFGLDVALVVAALFLVPVDQVMYLAGQPRAHYTVTYVLVPLILLASVALIRRHRADRPLPLCSLLFGLLCGFAFWTNMAVGPAIGSSLVLLAAYQGKAFFTRALPVWVGGFCAGFSPVIWYNLTHEAGLAGQVAAGNTRHFGRVLAAFLTNAWPRFWGVAWDRLGGLPLRLLFAAALVWVTALSAIALIDGWRRWRRGEDVLGHAVIFGYFALHLGVTAASHYGERFSEGSNPTGYIISLYVVAFAAPALVVASRWSRAAKALALLPLGLFAANNLVANRDYPRRFFGAVAADGLSRLTRYPNERNPFVAYARRRGHPVGYLGTSLSADKAKHENFPLNLEGFGVVAFADPASERYVANALAADAARDPFWVKADPALLRMTATASRVERVGRWEVHDAFSHELREQSVIPARPIAAPAGFAADRIFDTLWEAGHRPGGEARLTFAFEGAAALRDIVLFPADVHRSPPSIAVELSDDGVAWREVYRTRRAAPMFWSVFHPFLKAVKPRIQIALEGAPRARFCRLRFALKNARRGIGIREVLFLGDGPAIEPAEWEQEIDDVLQLVRTGGRTAVVAGDHWFMNVLRREGFETDYISNETFNDFGQRSPNLERPVPLALTRPHRIIVQRAHLPAVEQLLGRHGVPYRASPLRHHVILQTEPARVDRPLYWNGLELNELRAGRPLKQAHLRR